jgi:WD40 repeat protein
LLREQKNDPIITIDTVHVRSLAWSPDSNRLASGSTDGVIRIWNAHSGQLMATLNGHTREVNSIAWNSDGSRLASTGWYDESLRIWDTRTNQIIMIVDTGLILNSVAWSPDTTQLATSTEDGRIVIWDSATGQVRAQFASGSGRHSVDWHPDGTRIVATSGDEQDTPVISDAGSGHQLSRLGEQISMGRLFVTTWSPNGNYLASGGNDKQIRIWDAITGNLILTYKGHDSTVSDITWSPDSSKIASAGEAGDSTIRIWDSATGKTLVILRNYRGVIPIFLGAGFTTVDWSPDGEMIAAGDRDGKIYIWDTANILDK